MSRLLNERVLVLFVLLLAALALYASSFLGSYSDVGSAHSPVFFPRIILTIWIGLTLIALVQAVTDAAEAPPISGLLRLLLLVAAVLIYTNLVTRFGFFLTSAVFSTVCLPVFGVRHPLVVIAYALAVPGALVLLFNHTLGMPLPVSPFTHYF
ncbi:MAG: tripartite tricarboxylate transporter TctB family protein [Pseudomonadota bacterium]